MILIIFLSTLAKQPFKIRSSGLSVIVLAILAALLVAGYSIIIPVYWKYDPFLEKLLREKKPPPSLLHLLLLG